MDDSHSSESATSDSHSTSHSSYYYDSDGSNQYSYTIANKRYSKKAFKRVVYGDDLEKIRTMIVDCIKEDKFEPLESLLCRTNFKMSDVLVKEKGQTALHLVYYYDVESLLDLVAEYESGDNINCTDCNGLTHLHVASWANNEDLIMKCLENGADINGCFSETDLKGNIMSGITPLYLASSCFIDTVKLLLDNGADVNATTSLGRSALHKACCFYGYPHDGQDPEQVYDKVEIMRLLLDHGCDVNKKDKYGNTPLLCIYQESYFTAQGLWPKKVPMAESIEKLKLLLERGADVTISNNDGDNVLHRLIRILLCFHYVEPEVYRQNFDSAKHVQMAEIILNSGQAVNVNAKNVLGETPLQLAVSLMSANIVKVLLDHGADLNCLTFNENEEYCFCYPFELPKYEQVHNVVSIMEMLLDRDFKLTLNDNLMIMKFLTHYVQKCECSNVSGIEKIDSVLENWFVDSFRNDSTGSNLKMLMSFGSSSYFVHAINEIIDLSADEKLQTLQFLKQVFNYKNVAGLFIEEEIVNLVKNLKIKHKMSNKWVQRIKVEIGCMKHFELVDGITIYDIMVKHPYNIYQYVKNVNVPDLELRVRFYIYASLIEGHMTKALARHYVEKSAHDYVTELSAFSSLPELCTRRILYYLNNEEILRICLAAISDD